MKTIYYTICILFAILLIACEQVFFEEEPQTDPISIFEEFWNTYNTDYAPFEERNINWMATYNEYRPQVTAQTSDEELQRIIKEMLAPFNDTHIKFTVPNKQIYTPNIYYRNKYEDDHFSIELIQEKYFSGEATEYEEGWVVCGRIGNQGYIWFKGISSGFLELNTMLDNFSDTDGLIIDLRHNGGGDFTYSYSEMGRLTNEKRFTHRSKTINGPGEDDYTEWFDWYIHPAEPYFDKPLVLLTDRYTVSAGERFTMALKTLPNLVHMGDTTNGSLSTMIGKELPNGWYYTVCPQIIEFIDGKSYEGIGLIPDVVIENTSDEMKKGTDKTLEEALDYLNSL